MRPWLRWIVFFAIAFVIGFGHRAWQRRRQEAMLDWQPVVPQRLEAPIEGDPFTYALVQRVPEPIPERYARPLPHALPLTDESWNAAPPRSHVADLACAGDADMLARVRDAMRAAAEAGSDGAAIGEAHADLLRWCTAAGHCDWARAIAQDAAELPAVRDAGRRLLADCGRESDADLFEAATSPYAETIAWHVARSSAAGPVPTAPQGPPASLLTAARAAMQADDASALGDAARHVRAETPAARAELLALAAEASTPAERLALARVFPTDDPQGVALAEQACAELAEDPWCKRRARGDSHADELRKLFPDAIIVGPGDPVATAPAPAIPASWTAQQSAELERVRARLVALGLLPPDARPDVGPQAADDESGVGAMLLLAAGRADWFDLETGMYPNEHDSLARRLALRVGGELRGVIFGEEPPPVDDDASAYRLHAWDGRERVTVEAANLGDWWDADAVAGLVNTLLRHRGSKQRVLLTGADGQGIVAVGGDEAALRAAIAEGLLSPARALEGVEEGVAYENRVLQELLEPR